MRWIVTGAAAAAVVLPLATQLPDRADPGASSVPTNVVAPEVAVTQDHGYVGRAAFVAGHAELAAAAPRLDRALSHFRAAADAGYLPALWLIGKRQVLGGRLGPFEMEVDQIAGCALLERLAEPALLEPDPSIEPQGQMVDHGVSRRVATVTVDLAKRLAARRCDPTVS